MYNYNPFYNPNFNINGLIKTVEILNNKVNELENRIKQIESNNNPQLSKLIDNNSKYTTDKYMI